MKNYMKAMLGMAYKAANPPVVIPQQQAAQNQMAAWGTLQNQQACANALQGGQIQQAAQNQMAAGVASGWPPALQFEENVPEDELEFEGKLSRWPLPGPLIDMQGPRWKFHGIDCCQRCLML